MHNVPTIDAERLALVAKRTSNAAIITDSQARIVWVNEGFTRITGYSLDEVRGQVPGQLLQFDKTDPATVAKLRAAVRTGQGIRCEILNRGKSGREYWLDVDIQPLRDEAGQLTGFMAIESEITERKLAEQAIRESQQFLQTLVDILPQRIFWKDREGRYLGTNRAFLGDAGRTEVVGLNDQDMPWKGEQADFFRTCDLRVMESGTPEIDIIEPLSRPDGSIIWLSTCKVPLRGADGTIYGVLGTYTDISGLKRTEAELISARQKAEDATRAKSMFLAMMSHEIRTPMNAILGTASLLADTRLTSEQPEYLATIQGSSEALLALLNDILDISKIEAERLVLERVPFQLGQTFEQVVGLLQALAGVKGVRLVLRVAPDVPEWVEGDAARVRQVLLNLVGNAIKFTTEGSVDVDVSRELATGSEAHVRVRVTDSGVGIPEELVPRLFEPFTQADPRVARRFGGTGLGLAVCKRLVALMGGAIGVESREGAGSTFWFELPLPATEPLTAAGSEAKAPAPNAGPPERLEAQVLLAEDNLVNQMMARRMLEKLGCTVDVAANGLQAVDMQRQKRYDLILMDWQMPELDGLEATRRIRALPADARVPIIAMTANAMQGDRETCLQAGMDDYISKPISISQLRELLQRWIATPARL